MSQSKDPFFRGTVATGVLTDDGLQKFANSVTFLLTRVTKCEILPLDSRIVVSLLLLL